MKAFLKAWYLQIQVMKKSEEDLWLEVGKRSIQGSENCKLERMKGRAEGEEAREEAAGDRPGTTSPPPCTFHQTQRPRRAGPAASAGPLHSSRCTWSPISLPLYFFLMPTGPHTQVLLTLKHEPRQVILNHFSVFYHSWLFLPLASSNKILGNLGWKPRNKLSPFLTVHSTELKVIQWKKYMP